LSSLKPPVRMATSSMAETTTTIQNAADIAGTSNSIAVHRTYMCIIPNIEKK
jgi:hypothetical protein